jgi:hypothetical protein
MSTSPAAASVGDPVLLGKANSAPGQTTAISGGSGTDTPAVSISGGLATDRAQVDAPGGSISTASDESGPMLAIYTVGRYAAEFVAGHGNFLASGGNDLVHVLAYGPGAGLVVEARDHVYPNVDGSLGTHLSDGMEITAGGGSGVTATVTTGVGLAAKATGSGHAITAESTSATTSVDAVTIDYAGTSRAFYAQSHNPTNINGTVTGVNEGHGIGVWGEQRNNTGTGFGLVGVGGALGRGARLSGGAATLQMLPSSAATHPTTGKAGDFFVDASVRLWFCTKASSGSVAAVWKQLA